MEPFLEMYSIVEKAEEDKDIGISTESFSGRLFLLPINVSLTDEDNLEFQLKREHGNIQSQWIFLEPLKENISNLYLCHLLHGAWDRCSPKQ